MIHHKIIDNKKITILGKLPKIIINELSEVQVIFETFQITLAEKVNFYKVFFFCDLVSFLTMV